MRVLNLTHILTVLMLVAALVTPAHAGGLPQDLDQFIVSSMKAWKVPGLSIAVVKDGQVVLLKGYGNLEAGKPGKVDADTIFAIGSTSKPFTTIAIGTLVDKNKLKWDDHVVKHWPEFRMSDPWVTKEIRVSDLMANRSGLSELAELFWHGIDHDREELIKRLAEVPITEGFRYQFQYRNLMFVAAGQLIPRVTGTSWDDYVTETFFKPLQMDRTTTRLADIDSRTNVARPHVIDYEGNPRPFPYRNVENIGPAGAILSTARNMANWIRMQADRGTFNGQKFLEPATLTYMEGMQTPFAVSGPGGKPLFLPPADLRGYALTGFTESYRGTRLVYHSGDIDGMSAKAGLAPDLRLGIVVLSNLNLANLRRVIFYRIIDSYTDKALTDLNPEMLEQFQGRLDERNQGELKWQALNDTPVAPPLPIKSYAGKYSSPVFGNVAIVVEEGQLVYRQTPTIVLDLRCEQADTFLGKQRGNLDLLEGKVEVKFQTKNGNVTGFSQEELTFERVN